MATLEELREKLDGIDDQIAKLYEERMKVCEDVGRFKEGDSGAVRTADEYEPEIAVSAACGGGCTGKTSVY